MSIIGIDIGGTKINFVLVKNLKVVKTKKVLTPKNKKELIKTIKDNVQKLSAFAAKSKIAGIGLGVPSPLNLKGDLILHPPNLKYLRNCPLAKIIQKETGIKTIMENDSNCFTLGEALWGAGKNLKIVFGISLGAGLGGGIVINKKIHQGAFGSAGEVGCMSIKFDGVKCSHSGPGCLEEYCSRKFFLRKGGSPQKFSQEALKGNKKALKIYNEYGKYLGIGLANVINILDPEVIVIGGGISNAYQFFIKEVKKEIGQRVISPISKKYVKIKKAKLGEFAGAIGATLLINR